MIEVEQIPIRVDNYVHLARDTESGAVMAVDPGEAGPVGAALDRLGWRLTHIICTHHHADHVGGVAELKRISGAMVVGAAFDCDRIPCLDMKVGDGDGFDFGNQSVRVIGVPGHTLGHLAYYLPLAGVLFSGDSLFSLGCGRLFEGTPQQMWDSLCRLRQLPDETLIYCGHEYTNANADFALEIEPDNPELLARADAVLALRQAGRSSLPSTMKMENATNPFLRADRPELLAAAGLQGMEPAEAFAHLRRRKDNF